MHLLKIKSSHVLILINLIIILLVISVVYLLDVLRMIVGIPLVLFSPGLTLMLALFPKRGQISGVERLAFSLGLSIALVPLFGLILNYTPWGITLDSILYIVGFFIFIMSVIAWLRSRRLPDGKKPRIEIHFDRPPTGTDVLDKILFIILVVAVFGVFGTVGYLISRPEPGKGFTEFYLLGQEGKLADYPEQLMAGETAKIVIGIANHEGETLVYSVKIRIDGHETAVTQPVLLGENEKWEGEVDFMPEVAGDNQKVEFLLYKGDEIEPSIIPLHLWIEVKGAQK
jgi:uncharacterized membrane protein